MAVCPKCGCDKDGFIDEIKSLHLRKRPLSIPSTVWLATRLADELLETYLVVAHDGRGLRGEHYSAKREDLIAHLQPWLLRNVANTRIADALLADSGCEK